MTLLCSALYFSMIIIKRYRNRRLYHTGFKAFIVLADLEEMIRRDDQFKVIDTATGKDITLSVLTAVISERAGSWRNLSASRDVLRTVIKLGGDKSMSILKNTVLAGIGIASITKKRAEELIESLIRTGELSKSEKKKAVLELLAKAETTAKEATTKVSGEIDKAMKKLTVVKSNDLEAISKKVDKLARSVSKIEKQLKEMAS